MKLPKLPILTLASIICVAIVGMATVVATVQRSESTEEFNVDSVLPPPITQPPNHAKVVTADELRLADGKQGRRCYVAVDGKVYEIRQGLLWNNGQHDSSAGAAYCGADLTEALKRAPHGKEKLDGAPVIGSYKP